MRYQVDFLLPLKLQKISCYFGLCHKILLPSQFAGFFTFDLFDLLILILGVHCYIVLVYLDLIYLQTVAHSAVQENDIEKLAFAWFSFHPFYFVLDKQNYA